MHKPPAAADRLSPSDPSEHPVIAAVDLGSNSFHMIVGELRHGQLAILDRIRETVRLAEGLSDSGDLATMPALGRSTVCRALVNACAICARAMFGQRVRARFDERAKTPRSCLKLRRHLAIP